MNCLTSPSSSGRFFLLVAAISGIFLAAGCGSTSITQPNNNGFSNSDLNGTYVFSSEGTDADGSLIAMAGAFTANGSGGITAGTMDVIDPNVELASPVAQAITSGSYAITSDGRGKVTLASSVGTFTLDFVLASSSHGLISEFDTNGTGSGTIDLQTTVPTLSQLAGPYALSIAGSDPSDSPFASVGAFTLNSSGDSTAGVEDFNYAGAFSGSSGQSLSVSATLGSGGTAPGSLTLDCPDYKGALTYDYYPIDATHLKVIETDGVEYLEGDVFTQSGATIPNGTMVFTTGGVTSSGPVVTGGFLASNGTGNFLSGSLEDANNVGTIISQAPFTGTVNTTGPTGGRVVVGLSGYTPAIQWVIYPFSSGVSSSGLLIMEADSDAVANGSAYLQTATSFSASAGYGLNLTGDNDSPGEVDDIAQFNATSPTNSPNMTGVLDENNEGSPSFGIGLSGTYTPDSPATGRGSISVPTINTEIGVLSLEYYTVDGSTMLLIEGDQDQVASGLFQVQSSASSSVSSSRAVSLARPFVKAHAKKETKQ